MLKFQRKDISEKLYQIKIEKFLTISLERIKKMYCPNCGKEIKDSDNFCRFCGADLRLEETHVEVQHEEYVVQNEVEQHEIIENSDEEEYVLYDVRKHWMSLAVPIFLVPLFLFYFWSIFLNSHSFLSWITVIAILALIIYPIARYKSDKIIITNKFAHIKVGVLNPEEVDIPLEKLDVLEVSQTSMGRMFGYGMISFAVNSEKYDYGYIEAPEDLQYIIDDPARFIAESM